jgi:Sigma-70 region 2
MDGHRPHDPGSTGTTLSQAWHEQHRYLLDVAYRMLGSVSDAEDVVHEAFARLVSVDLDRIEDPRAWLVVVVSRLCLDQLRSARSRRETYAGPWLPEPLIPPLHRRRLCPRRQVAGPVPRGGPHNPHPDAGQRPAWRSRVPSGWVVAVFALTVRDGLVKHVHAIAHPYKLAYVMSLPQPNE